MTISMTYAESGVVALSVVEVDEGTQLCEIITCFKCASRSSQSCKPFLSQIIIYYFVSFILNLRLSEYGEIAVPTALAVTLRLLLVNTLLPNLEAVDILL
jgi:hypothetical protein